MAPRTRRIREAVAWARGLPSGAPMAPSRLDPEALAGLPEPARAYLAAAVPEGAPVLRAALIEMRGRIRIGARWLGFRAHEVLAPAHGFVWAARVAGLIRGSDVLRDGRGAMDWRVAGLIPIARDSGADVARSAAGRCAAEGVWLPSALLPGAGVRWEGEEGPGGPVAVARVPVAGLEEQALRIHLGPGGAPAAVTLLRFGRPDPGRPAGVHPFGMRVVAVGRAAGLLVPVEGRVGWFPVAGGFAGDGEFFRFRITRVTPLV